MFARAPFRLDTTAIAGSFVFGLFFVVTLTWMNGNAFAAPTFPLLAMMAGFVLAGMLYGRLSRGETVLEPAVAALLVAAAASIIIGALDLRSFQYLEPGAFAYLMVIASLNGVVFTFLGAWAGEKLQGTYRETPTPSLQWGWIAAGTILGLAVSLLLVNLVIGIFGLLSEPLAAIQGYNAWILLLVLFAGLAATGYICAFRSPGDTAYEAVIAGFITVMLLIDVFLIVLGGTEILTYVWLAFVIVFGLIASTIGGYVGEDVQAARRRAAEYPCLEAIFHAHSGHHGIERLDRVHRPSGRTRSLSRRRLRDD